MSAYHELSKKLKPQSGFSGWLAGSVVSPIREVEEEEDGDGHTSITITYSGPLRITIYGGAATLEADRLRVLESCGTIYAGQTVALMSNGTGPGAQRFLVLGVISNAV